MNSREQHKQTLKSKKGYAARKEFLLTIGKYYGVHIFEKARDPKDQLKSTFIRQCKTHGKEEVKMQAFMRGNFGCPHCAREKQSEMYAKMRGE